MKTKPTLPLPPPLRGAESGSFAEDTIKRRMPGIARRVLAENDLSAKAKLAMEALIAEMPQGRLRPLLDNHAPDFELWQAAIESIQDQNWLETPWFFCETYFYRRIIEAVDYFDTGFDPFTGQKKAALESEQERLVALVEQLNFALTLGWNPDAFHRLLVADLWGNQLDLSMWAADSGDIPDHAAEVDRLAHILVDDSLIVSDHLDGLLPKRIDFILDNAGLELLGDFALADYLLTSRKASQVHFHVKLHPTFVSDATAYDVQQTLLFLTSHNLDLVRQMGKRLSLGLGNGRLQLHVHAFWTSPHPLWLMPEDLRQGMAPAHLVICKGDANYRRALGDARWSYTTPIIDIVSYFPAPILFLRTCKSDVFAGLPEGKKEELDAQEVGWDVNGRWGVIQFVPGG